MVQRRPRLQISLSQPSLEDLRWWVSSTLHTCNSKDITPPPFNLAIRTDAFLLGWGATCNDKSTGGCWSVEEAGQNINCLEFKAAILVLKSFLRVEMQPPPESGPPSSMSYPSGDGRHNCRGLCEHEGGTQSPSLSLLAFKLWSFLLTRDSWVTGHHLLGVLNVEPGAALREFKMHTEWMLPKDNTSMFWR